MEEQIIYTHMTLGYERCRIISQDRDECIVEIEYTNGYWYYKMRDLTPIKKKV